FRSHRPLALRLDRAGAALPFLSRWGESGRRVNVPNSQLPQKLRLLRPFPLDRVTITLHKIVNGQRECGFSTPLREVDRAIELRRVEEVSRHQASDIGLGG